MVTDDAAPSATGTCVANSAVSASALPAANRFKRFGVIRAMVARHDPGGKRASVPDENVLISSAFCGYVVRARNAPGVRRVSTRWARVASGGCTYL